MTYAQQITLAAALIGLVTAGVALTAPPVHADPLTCQGQPVTVTGDVGTPGDDVMVVGSAANSADSGAGDDLVCIRVDRGVEPFRFSLATGPGDDRVFNESTDGNTIVQTVLGTGSDTYLGNDQRETVVAGNALWDRPGDTSDTEKDTIETRGGDDDVTSGSVAPGTSNADVISTGEGHDTLRWAGVLTGPPVDLGADRNHLALYPGWRADDLHVDVPHAVVTADDRPVLTWVGLVPVWSVTVDSTRTRFTGTDADESLQYAVATAGTAFVADPAQRLDADMAGGDDTIRQWTFAGGSLVGGPGEDALYAGRCLEADVRIGGTFTCLANYNLRVEYVSTLDTWENLHVPGGRVEVVGTPGPDEIHAAGSFIRVKGRGGDDRLAASGPRGTRTTGWDVVLAGGPGDDALWGGYNHDKLVGGSGDDRIYGNSGDDLLLGRTGADRLRGGKGPDVIRGGRGRDRANGETGRDRCTAEVRRSCERR